MKAQSFQQALETGDLQAIRAFPKADLHNHGFAAADREYVRERTGRDIVPVQAPLTSIDDMHVWAKENVAVFLVETFTAMEKRFTRAKVLEKSFTRIGA